MNVLIFCEVSDGSCQEHTCMEQGPWHLSAPGWGSASIDHLACAAVLAPRETCSHPQAKRMASADQPLLQGEAEA